MLEKRPVRIGGKKEADKETSRVPFVAKYPVH